MHNINNFTNPSELLFETHTKNILKLTIPIKRSLYYNNYYNNYNHQMESVIII